MSDLCRSAANVKLLIEEGAPLLSSDGLDLDLGQFPAMADRAVVALQAAVLVADDLGGFLCPDDFGGNGRALDGVAMLEDAIGGEEEHFGKSHLRARLDVELLDFEH